MASYAVTCPTDTWGSRNVAFDAAITMSASATKCSPPPAHTPLTAAITGFHTWLCHAVSRSSASRVRRRLLAQRLVVAAQLGDVEAGLEGPPFAGVHDHPHRRDRRRARRHACSSSASIVASMALAASGRSKISQPTGPRRSTISVS